MAKISSASLLLLSFSRARFKKTSMGNGNKKLSSMNKDKKRGYKKYRGQGK